MEGLSERERLETFSMAMQGPAFTQINTTYADTYRLKTEFLNKYWNESIQRKVKDFLLDGRHDFKNEISMESYFRKWAIHANYFEQPREDGWIVERMRSHFNERVRDKLDAKEPKTITEFAEILEKVDRATYGLELNPRRTWKDQAAGEAQLNYTNKG